jgi:hypothetical protein
MDLPSAKLSHANAMLSSVSYVLNTLKSMPSMPSATTQIYQTTKKSKIKKYASQPQDKIKVKFVALISEKIKIFIT